MSVEHMAIVLHHSQSSGTAKLVLLGIANHAGDGGAWPAVATLAKYAARDVRTVQRAIESLIALGELRVDVQAGGLGSTPDHRRPNRYEITLTCPAHCDRSPHHRDTWPADTWPPLATADDDAAVAAVDAIDAVDNAADSVDNVWINGVTPVSPGDASVTPPGDASVTLTTINNPSTPGPALPTDRQQSQPDHRPCDECGLPEWTCRTAQAAYPLEDRHTYRPHVRPPPRGVT